MKKFLCFFAAAMLLQGCRTSGPAVVERVRTDTLRMVTERRDSVWLHDSVFVERFLRGDTVFVFQDRWHTKFVERVLTDTVYRVRVDSVPVPCEVVKEVERELSWWQRFRMGLGSVVLIGVIGFGAYRLRRFFQ